MCCASAPGYSPAIVATTWRGRSVVSSAHSTTAPAREVAAEPARAAHDLDRVHVGPRAQLLQERAAQVLLDLLARLLDGHLVRQATAARCRNSSAVSSGSPSSSTAPDRLVARGDRDLAADERRHRARAAARAVADVARSAPTSAWRPATAPRPSARDHDRDGRPAASAASSARGRVPRRTAPRRPSSGGRRGGRSTSGAGAAASWGPHPRCSTSRVRPAPRSRVGPAASPHRTRRCGSDRPPRPA
jgi:hypothetical protein